MPSSFNVSIFIAFKFTTRSIRSSATLQLPLRGGSASRSNTVFRVPLCKWPNVLQADSGSRKESSLYADQKAQSQWALAQTSAKIQNKWTFAGTINRPMWTSSKRLLKFRLKELSCMNTAGGFARNGDSISSKLTHPSQSALNFNR